VFQAITASIRPLTCVFPLSGELDRIDPWRATVTLDPGDGSPVENVPRDDSAPCAGGANGWQFADDNTQVVLCGDPCTRARESETARVSIAVNCEET